MQYYAYEMAHVLATPWRLAARGLKHTLDFPFNPMGQSWAGRNMAAACDVFEKLTRRYGKPEFDLTETRVHGLTVPVREQVVLRKTFCDLTRFERDESVLGRRDDPKVLIVAPMSGHYATLLRGTVAAMLPEHDVYITDWRDARDVPLVEGRFDLDDYIDYVAEFVTFLGPSANVIAVCQPSVPVLAATAMMAQDDHPCQPASLTLMGGPIDTRRNPTAVNNLAGERSIDWFERNVISMVPFPNAGFMRKVYPGFIQLTGFMTMNLERHTSAHVELFHNLVKGDCDSVAQHERFYDEYLAVMDLAAEFYLQTVETVFQSHALPERTMRHRGRLIDCGAIKKTALLTIEGEKDDICGLGQTEAAHDLCTNIAIDERYHYVQPGVGHYGVFNGTRWRTEIQPRIRDMIRTIAMKRRMGDKSPTFGLPYRRLQDERENVVDWREVANDKTDEHPATPSEANGAAKRSNGKASPDPMLN
jgi:poly(3-hydroxybutyrate) depolymerase